MIPSYTVPLTAEARWELFGAWCELNPALLRSIERHAVDMWRAGHKRISAKYLVEWARYEVPIESKGIPFVDNSGKVRFYRICNTDTPALGRWLKMRHPDMPVYTKPSVLDDDAPCTS